MWQGAWEEGRAKKEPKFRCLNLRPVLVTPWMTLGKSPHRSGGVPCPRRGVAVSLTYGRPTVSVGLLCQRTPRSRKRSLLEAEY